MFNQEKTYIPNNFNSSRQNRIQINFTKASESKTKINQRDNLLKKNNLPFLTNNNSYKLLIKKIAYQLKRRTKLPKCKIFKFYSSYRTLILRIAKQLKSTANRFNFWEKKENEITLQDVDQIQEIASTAIKLIQKQGKKNQKRKNVGSSGRKNKKSPKPKLTLLKKSEEERLNKINSNIKIINIDDENNSDKILNQLKKIEINKDDINMFIKQFNSFLTENNIEIMRETKLPNITSNQNVYLLNHKEFWIKYIIYISERYKNELNIYNFLNFIEQFFLWSKTPGDNMDFIVEIKIQMYKTFDEEKINNFLSMNKLNNFDQLFERYKNFNIDNNNNEKYIEVKIDINNCTCPLCTNQVLIQKKVSEFNNINNEIIFSQKNNFYLPSQSSYIKFDKNKTLHNNGEVNIEYSIISNKYYDNNVFNFLNKIEKGKLESEKKKKRNTSTKKKSEKKSEKKSSVKKSIKEKKKEKKNSLNNRDKNKINAILDLMGLEGDFESEETY